MNRHTCQNLQNTLGKGIPRLEITRQMQLTTPFSIHLSAFETRPKIFFGDSHLNSYLRFDEATDVFF